MAPLQQADCKEIGGSFEGGRFGAGAFAVTVQLDEDGRFGVVHLPEIRARCAMRELALADKVSAALPSGSIAQILLEEDENYCVTAEEERSFVEAARRVILLTGLAVSQEGLEVVFFQALLTSRPHPEPLLDEAIPRVASLVLDYLESNSAAGEGEVDSNRDEYKFVTMPAASLRARSRFITMLQKIHSRSESALPKELESSLGMTPDDAAQRVAMLLSMTWSLGLADPSLLITSECILGVHNYLQDALGSKTKECEWGMQESIVALARLNQF